MNCALAVREDRPDAHEPPDVSAYVAERPQLMLTMLDLMERFERDMDVADHEEESRHAS